MGCAKPPYVKLKVVEVSHDELDRLQSRPSFMSMDHWNIARGGPTLFGQLGFDLIVREKYIMGDDIKPRIPPTSSAVNHPPHYGGSNNPYEAIKIIEALNLGFNLGNTIKYIARAKHKGKKLEDLKKALWYLQREITNLEESE